MNTITDATYPIQFTWVYKSFVGFFIAVVGSIILFLFGYYNLYLIFLVLYSPIYFVILILRRKNFHFTIGDKFMTVQQGILSKKQRDLPYGVIQNIFVKQDLFDRIFGLASLSIENASAGGQNDGTQKVFGLTVKTQKNKEEVIGFKGNLVSIPGLKKDHAEELKAIVLNKIKENPVEDNQSGL